MAKKKTKQSASTRPKVARSRSTDWTKFSDEKLLDMRICDLQLRIEETPIIDRIQQLYRELESRGQTFKPHCWLSDGWYSPDGIPGIAIPFFVAHPRLARLERKQMLEAEGGTKPWCMRILRHEAGHAYDTAFRLNRRKSYRQVFGNYSQPYPEYYRPKPSSKGYVLHLEPWYAQSHPAEDFAETFAVWLKPRSRWRTEYQGWPALKKVEYVDQLMTEVSGSPTKVRSRAKIDPVHRIKKTLREHYAQLCAQYATDCPQSFDNDLKRLFTGSSKNRRTAATFLKQNANEMCGTVARWTGEYRYNVNQVLREMIDRCRKLQLYVAGNDLELKHNATVMLTVHTMGHLHGEHHRVAL